MSIECPKCHSKNPDGQKFCGQCAAQLQTVFVETATLPPSFREAAAGEVIAGKYKLIEELGSGGMGVVYKAEQLSPVRRSVALKIIKLGMDTRQVVARFETERQALAVMDHSNIAKVFDGGATETGRPYFVMELVRGIPITDYCDKHKLTMRERLELFIEVCRAVQHAHQKGVIHRDLKPSNVLVGVEEQKPMPKIIDFGIAKATEHSLTGRTLFTEQGQLIGTPEYMSPEQAEMSGLDVDTRTDIYSLGVILYELMAGILPFDPESLRQAGVGEIQRIIRETEPPRASTRLSGLKDTQASIAELRRTDARSLLRELKGDLDWITVKAMAKDRTRRYATALELEADIVRHLTHQPVVAGPPGASYRIRKYIERHKVGVAAAALVVLAMVVGMTGTTIGMVKATKAEKRAVEETETAQQVSDFLVDLFRVSDPGEARGNSITAREILDKGAERIETELSEQPLIQARLMETIGQVYQNLGLFDRAEDLLLQMIELRREELGENHHLVGISYNNLAWLYASSLYRMKEAEKYSKKALEILESELPADHPETARALTILGMALRMQGDLENAQIYLEQALEMCEKTLGPDHIRTSYPLYHLGWLYKLKGDYQTAKEYYERVVPIQEKELGEDHPYLAWCLNDLAVVCENLGDFVRAQSLYERSLAINEKTLGPDHPNLAAPLNNLGVHHWKQGNFDQAESYYKRSLRIREKALGPSHPEVASILMNLALVYHATHQYDLAEDIYERAYVIAVDAFGPESFAAANNIYNLGTLFFVQKDYVEARQKYERALSIYEKKQGSEHPDVGNILFDMSLLERETGQYARAQTLLERAVKIMEKAHGSESLGVASCLMSLAKIFAVQGDMATAETHLQDSLRLFEKNLGINSSRVAYLEATYWALAGEHDKAIEFLKLALKRGHQTDFSNDRDFENLRGDTEFEALAAEFKKR